MKEFGLQLWSIRDWFTTEEQTKEAFERIGAMGYTYAQTAGTYDYITPTKFYEYAKNAGIALISTHYDYGRIKNDVEGTVAYHRAIGADYVGIGGAGGEFVSKERLLAFIDEFNSLADEYAKYGLKLTYHNHATEFKKVDGKIGFEYLIEGFNNNVSFCLDTYWAYKGGADVSALIERLAGRIDMIHLKDNDPFRKYTLENGAVIEASGYVEVGSGNTDFAHIIEVGEKVGVKYFIVEDEYYSTDCPMESVKISADYIKANLLENK